MILLISTTHGRGQGAERVLCELLDSIKKTSVDITIAAPLNSSVHDCALKNEFPVINIGSSRDTIISNIPALIKMRRKFENCTIVHAWSARSFELAALIGWIKDIPVTGTLHDHPLASYHGRFRQWIMKYSANRFNSLICVSKAVSDACSLAGYKCKLTVIHNGLKTTDYNPKNSVEKAKTTIGFMGLYAKGKGFASVVDWIKRSCSDSSNISWRLYGTPLPSYRKDIHDIELMCRNHIKLCGWKESAQIFNEIDILVHPSDGFDSLPTALIEAGREGVPVVSSSSGGSEEIIINGINGYIFDEKDSGKGYSALMNLAKNNSLRKQMGEAARKNWENRFKSEDMAELYNNLWTHISQKKDRDN